MFSCCFMTVVLFMHPRALQLPEVELLYPSFEPPATANFSFSSLRFLTFFLSGWMFPSKCVTNTHDGFKCYCYLYRCPFCFWVLSLSGIVWQQIALWKTQSKWVIFPFAGFEFVSLNCNLSGWGFLYYKPRRAIFPCLCSLTLLSFIQFIMFIVLLLEKMTSSEMSLLGFLLCSLSFSKVCVERMLFQTSNWKCILELARNLLCFHQNKKKYYAGTTFGERHTPVYLKFVTPEKDQ